MNVLMHCVYFPPEVGGLESHVYYLCRALVQMGHRVDVVTSHSMPGLPDREEMEGIGVWRTWMPGRSPVGWTAHAVASTPRTVSLARDADVLHAQAFGSVAPCAAARTVTGTPLVTTFHTSHFLMRAKKPRWKPVLGTLIRIPDHSFAASVEIAEVAEALAPGITVEALTNGVETSIFRPVEPALPAPRGPRIIVPRRLFEKNGVEYLVRAVPAILKGRPGIEVVVVGDGPERERIETLAGDLGVHDSLTFMGARPNRDMPGLLSSADVAVFPSLMEATSVAALEAMACEVPVAASRVGGLPEIVDDEVGILFEPADPEDLARAILELLERPDLADTGVRARRRVVEHWSNARLAERHLEVYRRVTGNTA